MDFCLSDLKIWTIAIINCKPLIPLISTIKIGAIRFQPEKEGNNLDGNLKKKLRWIKMTRCTVHTNDASPCLRNTAGETKGGSLLRRAWKQSTCKGYKTNILLGNRFIVNRGKTESQMKQQTYQ